MTFARASHFLRSCVLALLIKRITFYLCVKIELIFCRKKYLNVICLRFYEEMPCAASKSFLYAEKLIFNSSVMHAPVNIQIELRLKIK